MTILIIVTYKIDFSNEVIKYFKSQNMCNNYKFSFLPVGLDQGSKQEIIDNINEKLNNFKSLKTVVVFSDAGLPVKLAKRIKIKDPNVKLFRSKSSLIENGFLTYIMLNTQAPVETIEKVIDEKIEK